MLSAQMPDHVIKILEKRYLLKNAKGEIIETPDDMFRRVAKAVANGDKAKEEEFYVMMASLDWLPNSPTLMNAGTGNGGTLSACFVIPVEDSLVEGDDSIMQSAISWAAVQKFGGGVGASFSRLRRRGAPIKSTHGISCGAVAVIRHYSSITDMVTQGGKRHGANMGVLRVDHPEIVDFIKCKDKDKEIRNFNISVGITDAFMKAVKDDKEYDLIEPSTGESVTRVKARYVFDLIVKQAHKNGEPGLLFLDQINKYNPTPEIGVIEATNPCAELPMLAYESCNLGSINLLHMVDFSEEIAQVNWAKLEKTIYLAVEFLDNVIDINKYPLPQIEAMTKANRKIGLGVMGFADMLVALGIPYNSNDGLRMAEEVMRFVDEKSKEASMKLAETRGAFPNFDKSIYKKDKRYKKGIRNATTTTIAPTGTIGLIADVSQGIEPIFMVAQKRRMGDVLNPEEVMDGKPPKYYYFTVVNKMFERLARKAGVYNAEILEKVYGANSIQSIVGIPNDVKKIFRTAYDISFEWHIKMQAAFQKHVGNGVSKTINLPESATEVDVYKAYWLAYDNDCKGITVYRDNSRSDQVVSKLDSEQSGDELKDGKVEGSSVRPSPERAYGYRERITTGCGSLYVHLSEDEHGLCEIFTSMGQAGGCTGCLLNSMGRVISVSLRSGVKPKELMKQLRGNQCPRPGGKIGKRVLSCADAIGIVLMNYLVEKGMMEKNNVEEMQKINKEIAQNDVESQILGDMGKAHKHIGQCPECGASNFDYTSKCPLCLVCGWTECS